MMRLRDWPPRRIGLMWLGGCAVEALLVALFMWSGEPAPRHPDALMDADTSAPPTSSADFDSAMGDAGFTVTRDTLPSGQTITRIARDSSWAVARQRGDTITIVDASRDVQQAISGVTTAFVAAMDGLTRLFLIAAAILLPIPALLVSITLAWAVLRRR